jgi:hypothetical protein
MRRSSLVGAAVGATVAVLAAGVPAPASPPRPVGYPGIEVRQAGGPEEPVIARFTKARCRRSGGGFVAQATSTAGSHPMTLYAEILAEGWKGYARAYPLLRRPQRPVDAAVSFRSPGNTVYDSTVPVPGGTGGGAIVFARKGAAISIGGVFFLRGDTEVGIAVSGAVGCTYKKGQRPR